jgi:hypothetical protein
VVKIRDNLAALDLLLDTVAWVDGKRGLGKVQGARPNIQVLSSLATLTAQDGASGD